MSLTLGVHHIGLTVGKLEETASFFTEALGFKEIRKDDNYPAIFVSDGTIMITLWQAEPKATAFDRKQNIGLHHLALKVANLEDLQSAFATIKAHPAVTVEFPPELLREGPAQHCMVIEPSGIRVELIFGG